MAVLFLALLLWVFSTADVASDSRKNVGSYPIVTRVYQWEPKDMNPSIEHSVEVNLDSRITKCVQEPCTFDLHYFFGLINTRQAPKPLNILFISGGPGQIVDRVKRDLWFLEGFHNVIYFDMRGAGLSAMPRLNNYDRFLRAEHVVADIERVRQKVLPKTQGSEKREPWDAIYAHSYGTIIAQRYAKTFGKEGVRKLILSAPVARNLVEAGEKGTEAARVSTIITNLENIYLNYRNDPCAVSQNSPMFAIMRAKATDILRAAVNISGLSQLASEEESKVFFEGTNDFCFVESDQIMQITKTLREKLMKLIGKYGSIGFVIEHYKELVEGDKQFKAEYPHPEFFVALQRLQFLGTPLKEFQGTEKLFKIEFDSEIRKNQVNAALFLGYQLLPHGDENCDESAQFLKNLLSDSLLLGAASYKNIYCGRYKKAKEALKATNTRSYRALLLFGVNDGLSRWLFARLKNRLDNRGCLKGNGKDIEAFAEAPNTDEVTRNVVKKIGIQRDLPICLWNPTEYAHDVTTLILSGKADAVIAGCQAEEVFKNGLKGERAFIEFPGVGHSMALPVVQDRAHEKEPNRTIIDQLNIVNSFLNAPTVTAFEKEVGPTIVTALRASIKTALGGQGVPISGCV